MEPAHLVLDEPFTGLDWPARRRLLERLQSLHETGTSVVAVTYDLCDVGALADRVVVLADGEIAADGPLAAVESNLESLDVRPP